MEIFVYLDLMYSVLYNFFIDETDGIPFQLFGITHLFFLFLTIIILIALYYYRNRLAQLPISTKRFISLAFVILMFLNMVVYYLSKVIFQVYNWKVHLPLHLCFIAGIIFMLSVFFQNKKLYKIAYFMAFIGPLPAIIWPELYKTFDSFIFYHYIISHHLFLIANMFVFCCYQIKFKTKDYLRAFLFIHFLFLSMIIFNYYFHTNYIMSSSLPSHILKLYPVLKTINTPIVLLEIVGIIVFFLAMLPIYFSQLNKKE